MSSTKSPPQPALVHVFRDEQGRMLRLIDTGKLDSGRIIYAVERLEQDMLGYDRWVTDDGNISGNVPTRLIAVIKELLLRHDDELLAAYKLDGWQAVGPILEAREESK